MLFKQRKPRKFNYKARLTRHEDTRKREDIEVQWQSMRKDKVGSSSKNKTLIILTIALGMIIVLWYVLDNYQN